MNFSVLWEELLAALFAVHSLMSPFFTGYFNVQYIKYFEV